MELPQEFPRNEMGCHDVGESGCLKVNEEHVWALQVGTPVLESQLLPNQSHISNNINLTFFISEMGTVVTALSQALF